MSARAASSPADETAAEPATRALTGALKAWGLTLAVLSAIGVAGSFLAKPRTITEFFFYQQDLIGAGVALVLFAALIVIAGSRLTLHSLGGGRMVLAVALMTTLACWAGYGFVQQSYALSADEFMAQFDAKIFASGRLAAPLPVEWQGFATALQPEYMLPVGDSHWVSGYLPINAAFLALGVVLGSESLMPALWAGIAVIAAFGVARRLWPDRAEAAPIAALLVASAPQTLITAMTPFAMSAHLAANLGWLWLILGDSRRAHSLAAAVAFLACGIHQLAFFPLFAAPFLLEMWLGGRRWTAFLHGVALALALVFWNLYPVVRAHLLNIPPAMDAAWSQGAVDTTSYLLAQFSLDGVGLIAKNLFRFMTWQSLLTIPLVLLTAPAAWRAGGNLRALLLGLVLTGVAMFVVMPFQGHGWGYRYFHGLVGSTALLAAWGWSRAFMAAGTTARAHGNAVMAAAILASAFILTPMRALQAREFVAPYAQASEKLRRAGDDVVIIDDTGMWYGKVLVRNDPFLAGPIMLYLPHLSADQLRNVCAHHQVRLYGGDKIGGINPPRFAPKPHVAELRKIMAELGCDQRL